MKLLITTQAVDKEDPVLGFFHRWLEEFAVHCERVTVICLRKGVHELPPNVRVFVLGGGNKFTRTWKLIKGVVRFRANYDAVFVHMNPEYLVAAGGLWRLLGKPIALWYTHKDVNWRLRVATLFVGRIFTASKESFRLKSAKVRVMGHGIDTDFFTPDSQVVRTDVLLSVGRLMQTKRHDLAIRVAALAGRELHIAGEGPERAALEALAHTLGARVQFLGGLTQLQLREEYRAAGCLVHTSETGSLDKVVLESLACGLPVVTTNPGMRDLPVTVVESSPEALASALLHPILPPEGYVRTHHSLEALVPRMLQMFR